MLCFRKEINDKEISNLLCTVVTELNCHGLPFKNTFSSSPFLLKQGILKKN